MRRMAGTALKWLTKDIKPAELGVRVGMDALGGLMAAAYTPGDLGDKLIAGTATTLGGATGGLALGRLGGPGIGGTALDFVGSVGGDMVGSMLGEQVMKGKSAIQGQGFRSPYEKLSQEQQQMLAQQIRADVLRQYGLAVPGAPLHYADAYTGQGVS